MDQLPCEILDEICRDNCLNHVDLSRLSCVCKRFKDIANSNDTWKWKFRLAFPKLFRQMSTATTTTETAECKIWRQELRQRVNIKGVVRQEIKEMSVSNYTKAELSKSDFVKFDDILLRHNHEMSNVHLYVIDELEDILDSGSDCDNLTDKFYARKSVQHVRHSILRPSISRWLQLEEDGRLGYEEVMVAIAQWTQPNLHITAQAISQSLDNIARKVLEQLRIANPNHSIFTQIKQEQTDKDVVNLTQLPQINQNLTNSLWSSGECREILQSTNHVLYNIEGFSGNKDDYYNPDNSFINKVLESKLGIPISLCVLYNRVVARLGVLTLPVNFPGHFMLKWLEHPSEKQGGYTFIDAFSRGAMMTEHQARQSVTHLVVHPDNLVTATPLATGQRMLRNLISIGASRSNSLLRADPSYTLLRSALEMMMLVGGSEGSMEYGFMLSRVYLQLSINHEEVMAMLQDYRDNPGIGDQVDYLMHACQLQMEERQVSEARPEAKKRGVEASYPYGVVRFRVGQVCQHRKYNYTCVIYGWDPLCKASKSWIKQMGVDKLESQDKQPFYNVLVSDGSNRYAAQENLEPRPDPVVVTHQEVGKYFEKFDPELGYIVNAQCREEYPHDKLKILSN